MAKNKEGETKQIDPLNYSPGDRIKVTSTDGVFEGIMIPEPELLDMNSIILKLSTGYNIGIDKSKIKKIELIERYKKPEHKRPPIRQNTMLPTVSLFSLGGTISSKVDYTTGGVTADYTAEDLIEMCPELSSYANFKAQKVMSILSEDITVKDWQRIAEIAAKELNSGIRGLILTQGTDTLHYSAAALSFMLKNLNKPVIFTGAQRSIDRGSSDAFMNLVCSTVAASKFDGAVVASCMHATTDDEHCILIRGTKVRKMHSSRRDAFRPINELPLAKVYTDGNIEVMNDNYPKVSETSKEDVIADTKFDEKVALIKVYPGFNKDVIDFYLDKGYHGLVIEGTGFGNVATLHESNSLLPALKRAADEKVPVVMTSQTIYGRTNPYVYTTMRKLNIGTKVIYAEDILPEVAYIKLGWVLGHTQNYDEVKKMMLTNIAGEISARTEPEAFLY
ncbi:TPA: Glu-tRNA(Gln) amidotransferase subunit GatD [Candidatus Woesearchaeota archaeon]|nr:Glu-tRNA(Gln) amidotransferase subunit GatD [Candidatus Woesearchaeota archaeon]